jgi:putative FmdB family regulatory protein
MPTYEYRCAKGHRFDAFQKMSDAPVSTCPTCGEQAERLVSGGAGFLLKGEGFYITDYRSEDYKKKAEAEKNASGSPDSGADKGGGKGSKSAASSSSSSAEKSDKKSEGSSGSSSKSGGSTSGTES